MKAVVHKFGGVALANAEAIRHAVAIVAARQTRGVAVVVSAMGGVTDALLQIAALAKGRKLVAARRASKTQLPAAMTDQIVARGERLSAHLVTAAFCAYDLRAAYVDAARVIHASGSHGNAAPVFARSASAIRSRLVPLMRRGVIPV